MASPMPPEAIAPFFPQLEIIECLGRGGMGVVYKARQKSLNRLVALKLLAPERAGEPRFAARFEKEAHALAALSHPNIVGVYDFGQAGGYYFLLMEFVDGMNLRQLLNAKRLTPKEALSIVPPVCDALQCAHDHGIVHRDIKPENLLIDKAGTVKIADFGIAMMVGDSEGSEGMAASDGTMGQGTPAYAAPEQQDEAVATDHRADIYSLGVVLYEMLTGERPKETITPPSKCVQVDIRIDEVVLRALEKTPEMRFQTAVEFRAQVEAAGLPPVGRRSGRLPKRLAPAISTTLVSSFITLAILHAAVIPCVSWLHTPVYRELVDEAGWFGIALLVFWTAVYIFGSALVTLFPILLLAGDRSRLLQPLWLAVAGGFVGVLFWLIYEDLIRADGSMTIVASVVAGLCGLVAGTVAAFHRRRQYATLAANPGANLTLIPLAFHWWTRKQAPAVSREPAMLPQSPGNGWGMIGSALGMTGWMVVTAVLSGWGGAGIALCAVTVGIVVAAVLVLWKSGDRVSQLIRQMWLIAAGFVSTAAFLFGAHWLGLSMLSRWPGGMAVSPLKFVWALALFPLIAGWHWFFHRLTNERGGGADGSSGLRTLGSDRVVPRPAGAVLSGMAETGTNEPDDASRSNPEAEGKDGGLALKVIGVVLVVLGGFIILGQIGWRGHGFGPASGVVVLALGLVLAWVAKGRRGGGAVPALSSARPRRWQGWGVWVIGTSLTILGALWLLKLSEGPLLNRSPFAGAGAGSIAVLPFALATTILLAGAGFLYMIARNIRAAGRTRAEFWKRTVGRTIVPAIAVALLLRTFVIHPFVVPNDSMSPEITKGSRILVWKLTSAYAPGDIVAYRHGDRVWVARVTQVGPTMLTLQKNKLPTTEVHLEAVVGKVISVFWRPSPGTAVPEAPPQKSMMGK